MSDSNLPKESRSTRRLPLDGIRVLDLTQVVSGPYGSLVLANLGAEVIRLQRIDEATGVGNSAATQPLTASEAFDWGMNRNKLSVCIDLKSDVGQKIVRDLVPQVDVVISNFRPGKMEAMELGHQALRRINPRIVTCELNGFGSIGPWASVPAYDPIVQALSGTMSFTGSLDPNEMPVRWTVPIGDIFAGIFAAIGTLAALVERNRGGVGRHVEVSMHDVMLALNVYRVPQALTFGEIPVPSPHEGGQGTVPYGAFEGSDGRWLSIGVSDRMWPAACKVIGREDLLQDEDLKSNKNRWARSKDVIAIFRAALKQRPAAEWERELLAAGIVAGQVNTISDVLAHPQLRARDMIVEQTDRFGRKVTVIGDPLHWMDPANVREPSRAGADTANVLQDLLGLSDQQIAKLQQDGIIAWAGEPTPRAAYRLNRGSAGVATASASDPHATGPLNGVTVVELDGDEPSKGFAGRILADLGASVLKVARPSHVQPYPNRRREAAYRSSLDRNKQAVTVDIKDESGRLELLDRVKTADAILDNYRTGVLERLKIDHAELVKVNPGIVTCSITGYGHTGPWAAFAAFDAAIQSLGGSMSLAPVPPSMKGEPTRWGMPIGGLNGSLYAVIGILAGIIQKDRDGASPAIDISLLDAQAALLCYRVPQAASAAMNIVATPRRGGTGALPFGPFRSADGSWFVICITQQFWKKFTSVTDAPELFADPRFKTEALRQQHESELNALVEGLMARQTAAEWTRRFLKEELPGATVCNLVEAFEHPNVALRDMKVVVPDDEFGSISVAGNPVRIDGPWLAENGADAKPAGRAGR